MSPALASVFLIAVTLIAALLMSSFYYGLVNTFTSVALVSVSGGGSCTGTPEACTLTVTNSGSGTASLATACRLNFGGSSYVGTVSVVSGSLGGGSRALVQCNSNAAGAHATPGSSVTGWITVGWNLDLMFQATAN